jgi:chromosomal replication initiation ATPase DnaA
MTPTIKEIESYSCQTYGVTMEDINEKALFSKTSKARKMIYYLLFQHTRMQSGEIAKMYGVKKKQTIDDDLRELRFHRSRGGSLNDVMEGFKQQLNN